MEVCEMCVTCLQLVTQGRATGLDQMSSILRRLRSRIFFQIPKYSIFLLTFVLCFSDKTVNSFNVDVQNAKVFNGPPGIYFGYSVAILRNNAGNWLLVGAPKASDAFQPNVRNPGVLVRCPIDGVDTACSQVIVDTTGNVFVTGTFYGTPKRLLHDKNDEWLGVAVDVAPNNDKVAVCAHRWKDAKYVARSDLLYMQGLCYELDGNFQFPARLIPILVDYNSLVHTIERYPIWAYGSLGQSVQYTKDGGSLVMGSPGLNDWQGGFVIEDNIRRNFTVQPSFEKRLNWLIGYTITTAKLDRTNTPYIIAGAPRANENGSVYIFEYKSTDFLQDPLNGEQLGSYFGSVLCAVDVNGDQLDDVLVGAPLYSTNITEEGRVYVYLNKGSLKFERQDESLNGTRSENGRFGSAISNVGDLNQDGYNDIAVGAPYENEGAGAVYIYNGYNGGVWPVYTQRILADDVQLGLKGFGASLTAQTIAPGDGFGVGAFMSDRAIVLRSRPVVVMEAKMFIRPGRITATGPYIDLVTCFNYTGSGGSLQNTLNLEYTMIVDTTTPEGSVRALIIPSNESSITRAIAIQRDSFVCDQSVRIYAPYRDIWRDVDIEVNYKLVQATSGGPILEKFNGRNPGASLQNVLRKAIQYDKQCGEDNICDTDLAMIVNPLVATEGYIIAGETKRLEVKVDLSNIGENAYNLILDMEIHGNLSSESLRTKDTADALVDCALHGFITGNPNPIYRCRVRKPYPLGQNGDISFTILFPLDDHITLGEFTAKLDLKTEEDDLIHASDALRLIIKVDYSMRVESISKPEQVTLGLQQESQKWSNVKHKYSVKNRGPSPLENRDIIVYMPAIVHRGEDLVADIYVEMMLYKGKSQTDVMCHQTSKQFKMSDTPSSGGYAINVDCSAFPCRSFACSIESFSKDDSLLITISMTVSRDIISTLQARDTVRLISTIAIPAAEGGYIEDRVVTPFHKTSTGMERKKISIPIWLVIVSVVSAFLVLLVIVAILVKVGFFKRKQKEELERLKERRQSRAWTSAGDESKTSTSKEDMEPEVDSGHVNPLVDDMESDETGYHSNKDTGFLSDLSDNVKQRKQTNGYGMDDKTFD